MRIKVASLAVILTMLSVGADASASSPCGIYARIDEVILGPDEDRPTWILIKGDFLLVKTNRRQVGPARGYMCFSLEKAILDENGFIQSRAPFSDKQQKLCRLEWDDFRKLVEAKGKGKAYVAFGSAFSEPYSELEKNGPNVRETAEEAQQNPIPYPLHHGLTVLRTTAPQETERATGRDGGDRNPVLVLQEFKIEKDGASQ